MKNEATQVASSWEQVPETLEEHDFQGNARQPAKRTPSSRPSTPLNADSTRKDHGRSDESEGEEIKGNIPTQIKV